MPGVEKLLTELHKHEIRRCVVTNSTLSQVEAVCSQLPILKTLPHWITREDYEKPKPNPEGYLKAIQMYGKKGDRIIGF
jgi:beta-phosphoglucomutase-like phosphatase (HAD superfamily)